MSTIEHYAYQHFPTCTRGIPVPKGHGDDIVSVTLNQTRLTVKYVNHIFFQWTSFKCLSATLVAFGSYVLDAMFLDSSSLHYLLVFTSTLVDSLFQEHGIECESETPSWIVKKQLLTQHLIGGTCGLSFS